MILSPVSACIVPTFGRTALVGDLLRNLARQTRLPDEVVVVSQTGDSRADAGLPSPGDFPYPLKYMHSPVIGAAAARNRGAELTRADILIFLDDDVRFGEKLVESYLRILLAEPIVDVVHGGVLQRGEDHLPAAMPNSPSHYDAAARFLNSPHVAHRCMAIGLASGNFAVRRAAFFRVGGFDETMSGTCEDKDLGYRLFRAGAVILFDPEPTVLHLRVPGGGMRGAGRDGGTGMFRPEPDPGFLYLYMKNFKGAPVGDLFVRRVLGCLKPTPDDPLRFLKSPLHLIRLAKSARIARRMLARGAVYSTGPRADTTPSMTDDDRSR